MTISSVSTGSQGGSSVEYTICNNKTYAQTLFLGATIQSFTNYLGWGGEASRLTVDLIVDDACYPALKDKNNQDVRKPTTANHYINNINSDDPDFQLDRDNFPIIPGKVYYVPDNNGLVSLYHYGPDPGFYGDMENDNDTLDLHGTPVYFKYDNFEFNGIVTSWEKAAVSSTSSGRKAYTVTVESPAFLLNQTSMILGSYTGSIFTRTNGSPSATFGQPSYYHYPNGYAGTINQQNIPNVINVYGYLEHAANGNDHSISVNRENGLPTDTIFGNSLRNEEGIPANFVMQAMNKLLATWDGNEIPINPQRNDKIRRYSPFTRIIGKAAKRKNPKNNSLEVSDQDLSLYRMGVIFGHNYGAVNNLYGNFRRMSYALDISELYNSGFPNLYRINNETMSVLEFVEQIANAGGLNFFITQHNLIKNKTLYPVIKINVISTNTVYQKGAVQDYIENSASTQGNTISSYSSGVEFDTSSPVRTMFIGGKQKRLYQVRNLKHARQATYRLNPFSNGEFYQVVNQSSSIAPQIQYRIPDITRTRNASFYQSFIGAGSVLDQATDFRIFTTPDTFGANIPRGTYLGPINSNPSVKEIVSDIYKLQSYESATESVCPYYGTNLLTNTIRPVFQNIKGFWVEFTTAEIGSAIGAAYMGNEFVYISEYEIRASMTTIDAFYGFIFGTIITRGKLIGAKATESMDIFHKIIRPLLPLTNTDDVAAWIMMNYPTGNSSLFDGGNEFNKIQAGSNNAPLNPGSGGSIFDSNPFLFKLFQFFNNIATTYYGKQYMVELPYLTYWNDNSLFQSNGSNFQVGRDRSGIPVYMRQGSGKQYFQYQPTDFAWEEYGNAIDDAFLVGNITSSTLLNEDFTIPPILGFNASFQYDFFAHYNAAMYKSARDLSGAGLELFNFWKYDTARRTTGIAYETDYWRPTLSLEDPSATLYYYPNSTIRDAFDFNVPNHLKAKMYVKASEVEKDFKFYAPKSGGIVPKLIIKYDQGVFINPLSPGQLNVQAAIADFLGDEIPLLYSGYVKGAMAGAIGPGVSYFSNYNRDTLAQEASSMRGISRVANLVPNQQYNNLSIGPKAAVPIFAGIPIEINNAVYGPWISGPQKSINSIFPNMSNQAERLENLVGGSKVEVNQEFVPWNYGGMRVLDEIAVTLAAEQNHFQLESETGQVTVYGIPTFSIGNELKRQGYINRGPVISNINVSIGSNGASTTYTFRTFTKKFTLFNKESADRLKAISQNQIKANQQLISSFKQLSDKLAALQNSAGTYNNRILDWGGSKVRKFSPSTILVGYNVPFIHNMAGNPAKARFVYPQPGDDNTIYRTQDIFHVAPTVSLQEVREVPTEIDHLYSCKSFMGLDGLLTPVSLYPTPFAATTPYKKYPSRNGCPFCDGTKIYKLNNVPYACSFCDDINNTTTTPSKTNKSLPPFILSNQIDSSIIRDPQALSNLLSELNKSIDYKSLNPIIMPIGEFRNPYATNNDYTGHSIDVIGRDIIPPASLSMSTNTSIPQIDNINNMDYTAEVDVNEKVFNFRQNIQKPDHYRNMRFLALKGPLVMCGWGFDTDGYPVPNGSGEPKILNNAGDPLYITSHSDRQGNFIYEGTILGKNQEWNSQTGWSPPIKTQEFYRGWGVRQDLWPVGPIDLRWDDTRKVWSASSQDKVMFADVQLEDNLLAGFPARGFLNAIDKQQPLGGGVRRTVFVKDSSESYSAPRGAKLFCYYDTNTGFYEPVAKQNVIAEGTIMDSSTAIILNQYAKGFDSSTLQPEEPEEITIFYNNKLNFSISSLDQKGFFMFMGGEWVLLSTNGCS